MAESSFLIVAIEHAGSGTLERPQGDTVLRAGDGVTLLGRGGRAEMVSHFGPAS
jgi:trk system potassium uptake protein TrkA/voltage-gated potassium channel